MDYFIFKDGLQIGPFSLEQLRKMISDKTVSEDSFAKISGGPQDGQCLKIGKIIADQPDQKIKTAEFLSSCNRGIRIACPDCGQHYSVTEDLFKANVFKCSKCGIKFRLPPRADSTTEFISNVPYVDLDSNIPDGDLLCPHCWKSFDQDYILYISVHPSLYGDPILGEYAPKRFMPTVFNQMGQPLDERGLPATEMACPRCHLRIPSGLLDKPSLYFSIAGATSSGKSYFLTCLTHQLRKTLPEYFDAAFFDADPELNETLNSYEKQLFMSLNPDEITSLPATQISGEGISDRIRLDDIDIELPKPFVFDFRQNGEENELNMIFYDNSGEMFIPGRDEWVNQATFHLSHSNGIVFLFDPVNDATMRLALCDERDPQVSKNPRAVDQTILLNEMINRIRRHANMLSSDSCKIPLVIAVGKYDTWRSEFSLNIEKTPYITKHKGRQDEEEYLLAMDNIYQVSYTLREMMLNYVPGLVNAAESFFDDVFFIPTSNFGTFAEQKTDGTIGVKPAKISPIWVDVPILLLLAQNEQIPVAKCPASNTVILGQIVKDKIVFTHPANGKIIRLPVCYAGAEIELNGRKYRFPDVRKAVK